MDKVYTDKDRENGLKTGLLFLLFRILKNKRVNYLIFNIWFRVFGNENVLSCIFIENE